MNNDQRAMCFAEWHKCWVAIVEASGGQTTVDEKAVRMAVTVKAIGREKSWAVVWQQKEIDRLLGVMWAIAQSGNFSLQMRQQNQPLTRVEGSLFAQALLDAIGIDPDNREAYVDGICRRIHKVPLCDIRDDQMPDVLAALNHTRLHKTGQSHSHPRSPWQRRKSQRPAGVAAVNKDVNPVNAHVASRTGSIVPQGQDEDPF